MDSVVVAFVYAGIPVVDADTDAELALRGGSFTNSPPTSKNDIRRGVRTSEGLEEPGSPLW